MIKFGSAISFCVMALQSRGQRRHDTSVKRATLVFWGFSPILKVMFSGSQKGGFQKGGFGGCSLDPSQAERRYKKRNDSTQKKTRAKKKTKRKYSGGTKG